MPGNLPPTSPRMRTATRSPGRCPFVDYLVREVAAPYGFLLDDTVYNAYFTEAGAPQIYISSSDLPQQGKITVKKTNANTAMGDYSLAGAVFEIFSGSTLVDTITTNVQGEAQSKALNLGNYIVKEKTAPHGYVLNTASFPANLEYAGQNVQLATVSVTVLEQPQAGVIRLAKTNDNPPVGDYTLTNAIFEIRNEAGTVVDTITTDAQGKTSSKNLPLGSYVVSEKQAPYGYVRNPGSFPVSLIYAGQDVAVTYGDVTVGEKPQVGKITVAKRDVTTGATAQGDAALAGAVFEVYAEDRATLVDTIYCGAAVKATTKELPLGVYYIKEKTPPVGYTPHTAMHKVDIKYGDQDIEVVLVDGEVKNKVIEGQIAIVKHLDEALEGYTDLQIEQPLEDAKFHIYLKSAGSYANAKPTERDLLVTNENGWALSKKLPYGVYVVKEIEAPGDVKLVEPFECFVSQEGKIYYFILNDLAFRSLIKIVKVDAETGKTIGAGDPEQVAAWLIKNLQDI